MRRRNVRPRGSSVGEPHTARMPHKPVRQSRIGIRAATPTAAPCMDAPAVVRPQSLEVPFKQRTVVEQNLGPRLGDYSLAQTNYKISYRTNLGDSVVD